MGVEAIDVGGAVGGHAPLVTTGKCEVTTELVTAAAAAACEVTDILLLAMAAAAMAAMPAAKK